jgi:hypothetical protein
MLASASLFACGSLLGIDSPRILSRGADGGEAGANHEGGVAGESPAGGVAGTASGRGGTHASGSGGASGSGAGLSGSAGDAGANAGGAAGEPPDPGPTPGEACDDHGQFSCTTANPNITLACDSGTWIVDGICRRDQRCNVANADCERVDPLCAASTKAVCASNSSVTDCGVSQFQPPSRICPYGCQTGRCLPGTGDELIVHTDDDNQSGGPRWGEIPIRVCFLESDTDTLPAWIRSEAERTWGRYLNVEFTGWGECSNATVSGVVIEFLEDCELGLGGKPPNGFPGNFTSNQGQSRVGICSSYFNAARVLEHMKKNEPLLRFVVRHQFGHVLGLSEWERPSTDTVMVRALEKSNAARLELTHNDLDFFAFRYGHKPSGTLVTTSGLCLTPLDSTIRPAPCSQSGSGRFLFASGEVRSLLNEAPGCLTLVGDTVGLAPCGTASSALRMARARWSTPDRCVAPDFPGPGSAIATRACAPVGDLSQAWFFEIVATDQEKLSARLRFSATGDCLSVPGVIATVADAPVLETCGQTVLSRHVFYLWSNGQISFGLMEGGAPACLLWNSPDGTLHFGPCNNDTYWLSGALETPDGLALAIDPSDPNAELRADALGSNELPNDEQIFDFAF